MVVREEGMSEDMLWFWAVLLFTVPPVLRFRENFLVPGLSMLLTFGFFTQSYWLPDFYNLAEWPWIISICLSILLFYYVCGFIVHYFWLKNKSLALQEFGPFSPLFSTWIKGKENVVTDEVVIELRRFKLFELKWSKISRIEQDTKGLVLGDDIQREPEILSEIRTNKGSSHYADIKSQLTKRGMI